MQTQWKQLTKDVVIGFLVVLSVLAGVRYGVSLAGAGQGASRPARSSGG